MPRDYKGRPRNIPSQNPERKVPYFPDRQADQEQFAKLRGPIQHGWLPGGAFAVSTYDSRYLNSVEFMKGAHIGGGANTVRPPGITFDNSLPGNDFFLEYEVPIGRIAVIRDWQIDVSWQNRGTFGGPIDQQGLPLLNFSVDFLLNGSALPELSSIFLPEIVFGPVSGETFIIIPQGQKFGISGAIVPGINAALDNTTFDSAMIKFSGQLLLATGQTAEFEPLNQEPIPVTNKVGGVAR